VSEMSLANIREALVVGGISGPHRSHPRHRNIAKIHGMLSDDTESGFGLSTIRRYSAAEVLAFMAEITGCSPDLDDLEGDFIDPDLTVAAILAAARRLRSEATRGSRLLAVTGHPTGVLEHHIRVVEAYRRAGGKILYSGEEQRFSYREGRWEMCFVGGVGCLADGASLRHTHSHLPMEAILEAEPWPDIVLGDHGYAGAAIERGIPAIAVMDINDQALAVPWAEKRDVMIIPMDDNRPPRLYEPSWKLFEHVLSGQEVARSAEGDA
jgi:hypothetical protein